MTNFSQVCLSAIKPYHLAIRDKLASIHKAPVQIDITQPSNAWVDIYKVTTAERESIYYAIPDLYLTNVKLEDVLANIETYRHNLIKGTIP